MSSTVTNSIPTRAAWLVLLAVFLPAAATAQVAWHETPAIKTLYEKAKQETTVVLWGTQAREVDWVPAAFAKLFPRIEVFFSRESEPDIAQ